MDPTDPDFQKGKGYKDWLAWMDKYRPEHQELRRFRAEAAELLGIPGPVEQKNSKP